MQKALDYYESAADLAGHIEAIVAVAYLSRRLQDERRDPRKIAGLLLRAAEKNHPDAFFELVVMHAKGNGVGKDPWLATQCFRRAASWGHAEAAYRLGRLFAEGKVVEEDLIGSLVWLG